MCSNELKKYNSIDNIIKDINSFKVIYDDNEIDLIYGGWCLKKSLELGEIFIFNENPKNYIEMGKIIKKQDINFENFEIHFKYSNYHNVKYIPKDFNIYLPKVIYLYEYNLIFNYIEGNDRYNYISDSGYYINAISVTHYIEIYFIKKESINIGIINININNLKIILNKLLNDENDLLIKNKHYGWFNNEQIKNDTKSKNLSYIFEYIKNNEIYCDKCKINKFLHSICSTCLDKIIKENDNDIKLYMINYLLYNIELIEKLLKNEDAFFMKDIIKYIDKNTRYTNCYTIELINKKINIVIYDEDNYVIATHAVVNMNKNGTFNIFFEYNEKPYNDIVQICKCKIYKS